jgi:hypothetical protein
VNDLNSTAVRSRSCADEEGGEEEWEKEEEQMIRREIQPMSNRKK